MITLYSCPLNNVRSKFLLVTGGGSCQLKNSSNLLGLYQWNWQTLATCDFGKIFNTAKKTKLHLLYFNWYLRITAWSISIEFQDSCGKWSIHVTWTNTLINYSVISFALIIIIRGRDAGAEYVHRSDSMWGSDYIAILFFLDQKVSRKTIENLRWQLGGEIIQITFRKSSTSLVQNLRKNLNKLCGSQYPVAQHSLFKFFS